MSLEVFGESLEEGLVELLGDVPATLVHVHGGVELDVFGREVVEHLPIVRVPDGGQFDGQTPVSVDLFLD